MLRVGLTGGIGSGKSEVARLLGELGAVVVDYDALAREVVAPGTPGLAAVVDSFGPEVLGSDGTLDRARMADLVFADPAARSRLEAIVHPLVALAAEQRTAGLAGHAVVVHEIPLLVEAGLAGRFDVVVVVTASPDTQLDRLARGRGMTPETAAARMGAQTPVTDKVAVADVVIANDGSLEDLRDQVHALWRRLRDRPTTAG